MLLVRNIRLPLSCTERQAVQEALRILHLPAAAVRESGIAKISVDARHRKPVLVYTVAITLNDEGAEPAYAGAAPCVAVSKPVRLILPKGEKTLKTRPVVCGLGPAGLFCALLLARQGLRPGMNVSAKIIGQSVENALCVPVGAVSRGNKLLVAAPGALAEDGTTVLDPTKTEERQVVLELKLLADVGLVGFPNVGKSTLLSVVTKAHPKIANYHFTTLYPNLGVVYVDEGVSFVMADIPGIIEGASEGAGLGHDFLRHIDRCRLLVHLVDVSGSEGRDPIADFDAINAELKEYSPELATRPQIAVANKTDLLMDNEQLDAFRAHVEELGYEFFAMSAATHQGTRELVRHIAQRLSELPPVTVYEPEYVPRPPQIDTSEPLHIEREDDTWLVEGPWLQRLMANINFSDYESRMYFDKMLRQSGLFDQLEQMGIQDGHIVSMYDLEFEYQR